MTKFRKVMIIIAALLMVLNLASINYNDMSWSENGGQYAGIAAMILVILSMIFSHRHERATSKKE